MKDLGTLRFESVGEVIKEVTSRRSEAKDSEFREAIREYEVFWKTEAKSDDPKGLVSEFLKIKESLKAAAKNETMIFDFSGDFVDVGRYLSGEPECMVSYSMEESIKFLDVTLSIGRPHGTPSYKIMKYYAGVLNLVDQLEENGIRCKITASANLIQHEVGGRKIEECCKIEFPFKGYNETIDYKSFAISFLDNDFFTKLIIPMVHYEGLGYFDGEIDAFRCWTSDHILDSIETEQTERSIRIPSIYYQKMYKDEIISQKEMIEKFGIGFLFN